MYVGPLVEAFHDTCHVSFKLRAFHLNGTFNGAELASYTAKISHVANGLRMSGTPIIKLY